MPYTFQSPVSNLPGIGTARARVLHEQGIETIADFLYYFPRRHLDRTTITAIRHLQPGQAATLVGHIEICGKRRTRKKTIFEAVMTDGTGLLTLVWFNGVSYWSKILKKGDQIAVHGKVEYYNGLQMVHPELDRLEKDDDPIHTGKIIPLYPLTQAMKSAGLDNRSLRRIHHTIAAHFPPVPELLPPGLLRTHDLIPLAEALKSIHFAPTPEALATAVRRLKFDEHLFLQLLMALRREAKKRERTRPLTDLGPYFQRVLDQLPYELTGAQKRVLKEIRHDLGKPVVMNRLLQGDVGSGKTIVALLAAVMALGNGCQVAFMAPTEILAHQHFATIHDLAEKAGITAALLVGNMKVAERKPLLAAVADGRIQILVGTHALIQKDVRFQELGFVIIDEQHRFGVEQRGNLTDKGYHPHVLTMTATPIPRTLALSYHGDMDVSVIDELPRDRIPVRTTVVDPPRLEKVYAFVRQEVKAGRQCMIVYPLVEETEKSDLAAATEDRDTLARTVFQGLEVGLIHGRMKKEEKDAVMLAFSQNRIPILVATTVIEVGIDVPNATVMIIEHADRFGLTQLHQLRGRVGRGGEKSYCVLVRRNSNDLADRRLAIIESTTDGFKIADEDLKLRGPGEFFGIRQSGFIKYKIADLVADGELIRQARQAAFDIVQEDPHLRSAEHEELRRRFLAEYQDKLKLVNIA
ncbi:MAG: ATP-dependent DNA helicase RecG [Fidelibacterota bacterium]